MGHWAKVVGPGGGAGWGLKLVGVRRGDGGRTMVITTKALEGHEGKPLPEYTTTCTFLVFCPDQGELAYPVHHMVLETTSQNQGSELSGSTMIPPMTVVADLRIS